MEEIYENTFLKLDIIDEIRYTKWNRSDSGFTQWFLEKCNRNSANNSTCELMSSLYMYTCDINLNRTCNAF